MIVMMVLAIAMMGAGLQFSIKFFDKAETMRLTINDQTEQRIRNLLDDGSLVANPLNRAEVRTRNGVMFALGINNQLSTGTDFDEFRVTITRPTTGIFPSGCSTDQGDFDNMPVSTIMEDSKIGGLLPIEPTIRKNQAENVMMYVYVPANTPACTYVFQAEVDYYDTTISGYSDYTNQVYKFYLKVR